MSSLRDALNYAIEHNFGAFARAGQPTPSEQASAELDELMAIRDMLIKSGIARMLPSKGISPELAETHKRARVFSRDAIDVRALALAALAHEKGVRLCACGLMSAPHGPCWLFPQPAGEVHGRRERCEACCLCTDTEYKPDSVPPDSEVDSDDLYPSERGEY